jgi:hypothetical protein
MRTSHTLIPLLAILLQLNATRCTAEGIVVHTNNIETVQKAQYDQIERHLDKQIAEADRVREKSWKRDFSSLDAYEKSVEPWRGKLAQRLAESLTQMRR